MLDPSNFRLISLYGKNYYWDTGWIFHESGVVHQQHSFSHGDSPVASLLLCIDLYTVNIYKDYLIDLIYLAFRGLLVSLQFQFRQHHHRLGYSSVDPSFTLIFFAFAALPLEPKYITLVLQFFRKRGEDAHREVLHGKSIITRRRGRSSTEDDHSSCLGWGNWESRGFRLDRLYPYSH